MFEKFTIGGAFTGGGGGRIPVLFVVTSLFVLAEYLYAKLAAHDDNHDGRETAASLGISVGGVLVRYLFAGLTAIPFFIFYSWRQFDIPMDTVWAWIALFFGVEFFYYWFHRASHRIRWFWATHSVHHSPTKFNLSAAVRLGWTGQISGAFVFYLPLALIGFHPGYIGLMLALGLFYQFFLHTMADVNLGPLEYVLNTPRHHRVHHACNDACLDVNYGSTVIIFDRMFGTFAEAPKSEPMRYGLKGRVSSTNVFRIAFDEWGFLFRDVWRAKSWRDRWRVLSGPP